MTRGLTQQLSKHLARGNEIVNARDRIIDAGIRIYIVEQDLKHGIEAIPGTAPVRATDVHYYGAMVDTLTREVVGDSERPFTWYATPEQYRLLLHEDPLPKNLLVYGAMGAGKTTGGLAPWLVMRSIELIGLGEFEGGATAPTRDRTALIIHALREHTRRNWYTYWKKEGLLSFRWGVSIRLVTTTPRSAELGNPIQGWNWAFAGSDELQDSIKANGDIKARGRRAPGGIYKRLNTATAKDTNEWRKFKDGIGANPKQWHIARLEGPKNPFVYPSHWEEMKLELSERDYIRKVLAMDVGAERAVYPAFDRALNIRPIPLGAVNITPNLYPAGFAFIGGNDPGSYRDVLELVQKYRYKERNAEGRLVDAEGWWAVGEHTTEGVSFDTHTAKALTYLQDRFNVQHLDDPDSPRVIVRCEPWTDGNSAGLTHQEFMRTWKRAGIHAVSAAFKDGTGKNVRMNLDAGVEMVNRLLCNAAGQRRLFIACDDAGKPACPKLAEALQSFERDAAYKAKGDKRHKEHDLSDWPMALTLALWPYERLKDPGGVRSVGAVY